MADLKRALKKTGLATAQLARIGAAIAASSTKKKNFNIRLSSDMVGWLTAMGAMGGTDKINVTIQQTAVAILLSVKEVYETDGGKPSRDDAQIVNRLKKIGTGKSVHGEVATYTIRFSDELASWLGKMAEMEMKVRGKKNVSIQQAAATILMLCKDMYESS